MLVVLVGGAIGLITVLVKAVIDAGSKSRRLRGTIAADVALLRDWPDGVDGEPQLRARLEDLISEYTGATRAATDASTSTTNASRADPQLVGEARAARLDAVRRAQIWSGIALLGTSLTTVGAGFTVANGAYDTVPASDELTLSPWVVVTVVGVVLLLLIPAAVVIRASGEWIATRSRG